MGIEKFLIGTHHRGVAARASGVCVNTLGRRPWHRRPEWFGETFGIGSLGVGGGGRAKARLRPTPIVFAWKRSLCRPWSSGSRRSAIRRKGSRGRSSLPLLGGVSDDACRFLPRRDRREDADRHRSAGRAFRAIRPGRHRHDLRHDVSEYPGASDRAPSRRQAASRPDPRYGRRHVCGAGTADPCRRRVRASSPSLIGAASGVGSRRCD